MSENPFGQEAADIAWEPVDADRYDPVSDSPLLDNDMGGLLHGGPDMLMEAARRREAGATLTELRRDLAMDGMAEVTDGILDRAIDQGARLAQWSETGHIAERARYWSGLPALPFHTNAERDAAEQR